MIDFSEYPQNSKICDAMKKTVICKMKNKTKVILVVDFGGLKSKTFSITK